MTRLDYAVNRFYSSQQGRFTQVDPIGMDAVSLGSPQTLNLYAYCGNDPINHADPAGTSFFGKLFGWIGKAFKWAFRVLAVAVAVVAVMAAAAVGQYLGGILITKGLVAFLFGSSALLATAGWAPGKIGQIAGAIVTAGLSWGSNFRTPSTFPKGTGVGPVSQFVSDQDEMINIGTIMMPTEPAYSSFRAFWEAVKGRLKRINYVKIAVGVANVYRGAVKLYTGVPLLIKSAPWAVGGIGAAPESGGASLVFAIPAIMSAKDSVGGVFLIRRGVRQAREAWDAPSRGEWQNLLGLLPFGSHFDDPGELSTTIGKIRKLSLWEKIGELTTW